MPGNLFTPVTVRRRSAAQGCANAHTDAAAPVPVPRWVVESVESMLASAQYGGLWAFTEVMNGFKICFLTPLQHLLTTL